MWCCLAEFCQNDPYLWTKRWYCSISFIQVKSILDSFTLKHKYLLVCQAFSKLYYISYIKISFIEIWNLNDYHWSVLKDETGCVQFMNTLFTWFISLYNGDAKGWYAYYSCLELRRKCNMPIDLSNNMFYTFLLFLNYVYIKHC